jgi:hypothetical protein
MFTLKVCFIPSISYQLFKEESKYVPTSLLGGLDCIPDLASFIMVKSPAVYIILITIVIICIAFLG